MPMLRAVALLLATPAAQVFALGADSEVPIEIEADSAELREADGTAIYRGHVVAIQGGFRLESDTLTITERDDGEEIVATGAPVRFHQQPEADKKEMRGHSLEMRHLTGSGDIVLTGEAWVWQEGSTLASDQIHYNSRTEQIQAGQAAQGSQRVHSVIKPGKRQEKSGTD